MVTNSSLVFREFRLSFLMVLKFDFFKKICYTKGLDFLSAALFLP